MDLTASKGGLKMNDKNSEESDLRDSSPRNSLQHEDEGNTKADTNNQVDGLDKLPSNDIFFIDKKGGETQEQPSIYTTDYVYEEPVSDSTEEAQPGMECFNCGGNHHVSDCTKALDSARISRKRKEMARNASSKKIGSDKAKWLVSASGHGKNSCDGVGGLFKHLATVHNFHYQDVVLIRTLEGFVAEIQKQARRPFKLTKEDEDEIEDGEIDSTEKRAQYDPSRLISFPGFNVPLPPGVLDLHEEYNMPPMQPHQQKYEAEKYMSSPQVKPLSRRAKFPAVTVKPSTDTGPVVDMDMDDGVEDGQLGTPSTVPNYAPLNGTNEPSTPSKPVYIPTPCEQLALRSLEAESEQEGAKTLSKKVEAGAVLETAQPDSPPSNSGSQEVVMGTPFLMGFSPYTRLPPRENFAKGVSEYIPFENLPGSTGTFEKLRGVISRVRAALQGSQKEGGLANNS
ncbi:unnamed protein product [Ixodes pacificus]